MVYSLTMRNRYRNVGLLNLTVDIMANVQRPLQERALYLLQVFDVIDIIRDGSQPGARPMSRSDVCLLTKIPAETLKIIYHDLLVRKVIIRSKTVQPRSGRQAEMYALAGQLRTKQRMRAQNDRVLDLGCAESIQWDILQDLQDSPVGYLKQIDVRRKYCRRLDPEGRVYGGTGVVAHIDALVTWGRLRRVTGTEALKLLGCTNFRTVGRRPILLVRGPSPVHPSLRDRAVPHRTAGQTPDHASLSPAARAATEPSLAVSLTAAKPTLKGDIDDLDPVGAEELPGRAYPTQVTSSGYRRPILVDAETGRRLTDEEVDAELAQREPEPVVLDNQPGPDER